MQMERLQASHQAEQGALQAAMDSLQAQSRQLQTRHQEWAWQLAALLHWKRQGAMQLRKLLQSWAMLTAASRSRRAAATASHRGMIRSSCEASCKKHGDEVSGGAQTLAEPSYCAAGAENRLEGPMPDGWAHHDRRMLGGCFRGTYIRVITMFAVLSAMLLMRLHQQQRCDAGKAWPPRCHTSYPFEHQLQ